MHFVIRPSKSFIFGYLKKKLSKYNSEIGLDAASAGFKNRVLFKTKIYYGLDIEKDLVVGGVNNANSPYVKGIVANMSKLDRLPSSSVDVIVSTFSLYHMPYESRIRAVNHLCRLTSPSGVFMLELIKDNNFKLTFDILKEYFYSLEVIYFKNFISRFYEKIFENKESGYLGGHRIAGLKPFLLLSWVLGKMEHLTKNFSSMNTHVFIICKNKRDCGKKENFDLSKFPMIGNNIFDLR